MKVFLKNVIIKKILMVFITIIMVSNFIMPNYVCAVDDETKNGGSLFTPITSLIVGISDRVIATMQEVFVGKGFTLGSVADITVNNGEAETEIYSIKYSPGIIFSGKVPAFDINFFQPMGAEKTKIPVYETEEVVVKQNVKIEDLVELDYISASEVELRRNNEDFWNTLSDADTVFTTWEHNGYVYLWEQLDYDQGAAAGAGAAISGGLTAVLLGIASFIPGVNIGVWAGIGITALAAGYGVVAGLTTTTIADVFASEGTLYRYNYVIVDSYEKASTAAELRGVVSTWYNALRTLVIVALLSVLVYIGIRIILSSNSAQNQAKYKNMLKDWVVALCIVFSLHYIMAFVCNMTGKIIEVFDINSTITPGLEDKFMSNIRNQITGDNGYWLYFGYVVMYLSLVIMTITFTIQYLKRVIYIAFLTVIAPLIALTYPIDKVKDGNAQAFSMWIKEYVFNCLLQPIHLLLYTLFVDSASNFITDNPIYAIVALGFMMPAEKFFKKMFGFDKAQSVSNLGAAAGGAMVMNMLNKLKNTGKGKNGDTGGANSNGVRTANNRTAGPGGPGPGGPGPGGPGPGGPGPGGPGPGGPGPSGNRITPSSTRGHRISGVNRFASGTAGRLLKTGGGLALGAASGIVSFAANVADGDLTEDPTKALGEIGASAAVGYVAGKNLSSRVGNRASSAKNWIQKKTLGIEEFNNRQFDKKFYQSEDYKMIAQDKTIKEMCKKQGISVAEATQTFLNAGITDAGQIREALQNGISGDTYAEYKAAGASSAKDIAKIRGNVTPDDYKILKSAGIDSAEKMNKIMSSSAFKDRSGNLLSGEELKYRKQIAEVAKNKGLKGQNFINYATAFGMDPADARELQRNLKEYLLL